MSDKAYIAAPEQCDFCKMEGQEVQAEYDGATRHGPWAFMCGNHFRSEGLGLGTGRGQRLIVGERPKDEPYTEDGDIEDIPPLEDKKPTVDKVPTKLEWPNM